jgi:hypothetical protein
MTCTDHRCAHCNSDEPYKVLDLYMKYKDIVCEFSNGEQDASVGTYERMYYRGEHANYYAKLETLGPLLISLTEDNLFYHVLIRSVIGFKNLRFDKHFLCNTEKSFVVKLALDQYFLEIYKEKWAEQRVVSTGGLLSRLDVLGIFCFSAPTKDHAHNALPYDTPDADTVSTFSSYPSARSAEKIRADILAQRTKFSSKDILKKLLNVEKKHFTEILELDKLTNDEGIVIDVVIERNTPTELLAKYFGREVDIHRPPQMLNKGKTTLFTEAEVDAMEIGYKDSVDEKHKLMAEFVVTEVNYFFTLQSLHDNVVLPLQVAAERSKDTSFFSLVSLIFEEFIAVFEFSRRFATRIAASVVECGDVDLPTDIARKIEALVSRMQTAEHVPQKHNTLERMILAFEEEFEHIGCYRSFCRNAEGNIEMFMKPENLRKMGAEQLVADRSIKEIFRLPAQRLCRYHLILHNLLKFIPHGSEVLKSAKIQLLKLRAFLKEVNDDNAMLMSIKTTLMLQNAIERCRLSLSSQKRAFVGKCDCIGSLEGITLVMFTDMLLVLLRRGGPVEISEIKNEKIYRLVKAVPLEDIAMQNMKGEKFKLLVTEDGPSNFAKMPGSSVYNDEGIISETIILRAYSLQEKRVFLKAFSTLKSNLEFNRLGGRLFVREERTTMFFYVYEREKYAFCRHDRDMIITCTSDPALLALVVARNILHGELDLHGTLIVSSPKNFKCVDAEKVAKADICVDLCDVLYNALELHRSVPKIEDSIVQRFAANLEALATTFTYDRRQRLCHFVEYDLCMHMAPDITSSVLKFVECKLAVLKDRRLLVDKIPYVTKSSPAPLAAGKTSFFRDAFFGQTPVFASSQSLVYYNDLYRDSDNENVASLYNKLCRKSSVEERSLEKIDVAELTSVIVLWLRRSVFVFFSSKALEQIHRSITCRDWLGPCKMEALVYHCQRPVFKLFLQHLCVIALTVSEECVHRLFSVFLPAEHSKEAACKYVAWLAKQINKS